MSIQKFKNWANHLANNIDENLYTAKNKENLVCKDGKFILEKKETDIQFFYRYLAKWSKDLECVDFCFHESTVNVYAIQIKNKYKIDVRLNFNGNSTVRLLRIKKSGKSGKILELSESEEKELAPIIKRCMKYIKEKSELRVAYVTGAIKFKYDVHLIKMIKSDERVGEDVG